MERKFTTCPQAICKRMAAFKIAVAFLLLGILQMPVKMLNAQSVPVPITGTVTNAKGEPIQGVTVKVKEGTGGTSTDADGNFSLTVPNANSKLVFSFIGYLTQEAAVNNQQRLAISLTEDAKAMDAVVVVGYGTQKREKIIGSVATVSAEKLEGRPVTQLSHALSGQMAGVTVIQRSGRPGESAANINVRGVGSFGSSSGALVIIDGVPGQFNDIDPNDVASISVLKDASSAAIYGARAANGVILVTTKTGREGKTAITYNGYVGLQDPTAFPDYVDSWDYAAMFNEATGTVTYTPEDIQKFRDGTSPDTHPNTDFVDAVFSRRGIQTGHNLSVSGGTARNQYNLSLGYLHQQGPIVKNNYDRYNIRLNMKTALNNKFDLTTRIAAIKSGTDEPAPAATAGGNMLDIIKEAVRFPSIYAGKLSNGDYGTGAVQRGTPISFLESESFVNVKELDLNANLRLDYKVINNLKLSFISAYNQRNSRRKTFLATQVLNANITLAPNNLTLVNQQTDYYTLQALAEYNKQFGRHQFSALAGYSFEENKFEQSRAFRDNLPSNSLNQLDAGSAENQQASGSGSEWALESQFGRINYSYANKYLAEAVIRRDGSSRFPTSKKYAYFPSGAIGYRIGQENFIRDNFSWISELKLKASIGVLGNQNIGDYPYQNVYNIGTAYNYPFGGTIQSGVARTTIVDPTLHWESTRTTDLGVDLGVFNGKLNLSATYFDRFTYDILVSPGGSVASALGFSLGRQNSGELSNKGWEFLLSHNNKIGNFSYNIEGNFSIIKNKVLDLGVGNIEQPNGMIGNGSSLFVGQSMQVYYGYQADGIFTSVDDVQKYADQKAINPSAQPGDVRYKDLSGPDGVPDGQVDATYDRIILGSNIPKYTFGLNLGASYKGFDFSMLLQGMSHVKNFMNSYVGYAFYNTGSIQRWQMEERWTADNPRADAGYPRLQLMPLNGTPNTLMSSFWVLDGSYLRAKNIQIGYTLPKAFITKLGLSGIRFYASGENLITFSNYRKGWDPEMGTDSDAGNDNNTIAADAFNYPLLKNYTLGVTVKF